MRLLVYEFITAGGLFTWGDHPPAGSLLAEGYAMLSAICQDFVSVPGVELRILWDDRLAALPTPCAPLGMVASLSQHHLLFEQAVRDVDAVLVIAPELRACLLNLTQLVEQAGKRLIGADSEFVRLASDKLMLARLWRAAQVPTPSTWRVQGLEDLVMPADDLYVLKPPDGAGSHDVSFCNFAELVQRIGVESMLTRCVQRYHAGRPASIAALCRGHDRCWLPPCWQHLDPPDFAYRGGSLVTDHELASRVRAIAGRALDVLPPTQGYVGVDVVLGDAADGTADVAIEVNPRLTTSYVGIRRVVHANLAELMLQTTFQNSLPDTVACSLRPLEFDATGRVAEPKDVGAGSDEHGLVGT